uniref:WRKY domain-containing protein n=1 Tax=Cannabis sativa TaxID=3483 RepID=A0A803PI46_CANSA
MENNYLSKFLPFPTNSSSPSSSSSLSLSTAVDINLHNNSNNQAGYNNIKSSSSNDDNNNIGFLGLMSEMEIPATSNNDHHDQFQIQSSINAHGQVMKLEKRKGDQINSNKKARKPRYAFQTRSQVDILDDGYRWRKYGQKAVKNNKFPSYYRCTHQGCNVKKQVQRLTKDEGIVVTTYEGMHSHTIDKSTDNFEHILSQMQIYTTSF